MARKKKDEDVVEGTQNLSEQEKAKHLAISAIEKQFGKGSVFSLSKEERFINRFEGQCLGTGIFSVDEIMTNPFPRGRIIEMFGPESSGKTTLAIQALASGQKRFDEDVAIIDAEHALDTGYSARLGLDLERTLISQPSCGEDALNITEQLARSGAFSAILVDSVAALTPRAEIEGEIGDSHMGLQARMMGQAMRKLAAVAHSTNTCIIFINQLRMKIGVMFGSPETTPGGNALKFYASQRIDIRRIGQIKTGEDVTGAKTKIKIVKNKVGVPFGTTEIEMKYGMGFDPVSDMLEEAVKRDVVGKAGAWYSYNEEKIGQGKDKTCAFLLEHPQVFEEISAAVQEIAV